jgi:uncharacterized protein YndB with AHSA1/START domain
MSIEFQLTEILPGPPDRVFRALTDLEGAAQWMPGFRGIERVGDVRQGVGMRWRESRKIFGKEATEEFEVTHFHPPSHLAVRVDGSKGTSGRGTYEFDYRLAQRVGGTEVRMTGRIDGLSPVRQWLGSIRSPYKSVCAKDLRALGEHLRQANGAAAPPS